MRRRLARVLRLTLRLLLGAAVLACLLWLLRVPLFGGWIKDRLTEQLAEAIGGRYEIDDVGGNWLTHFRVSGLRTVAPPESGLLVELAVDQADVEYDLWDVLGDKPLAGLHDLTVSGARLRFDVTRSTRTPSGPAGASVPDLAPFAGAVRLDAQVVVEGGADRAVFDGVHVMAGRNQPLQFSIDAIHMPDRFRIEDRALDATVTRTGAQVWEWTSTSTLGDLRFPKATFTSDGRVDVQVEVAGGTADVALRSGRLSATLRGLDLARLPAWAQPPEDVRYELPTSGLASGTATYVLGTLGSRKHTATVELVNVRWRGERIRRLALDVAWAGASVLDVKSAALDSDRAAGTLTDGAIDIDAPYLLRSAAQLDVAVPSLRAFVPDLPRDARLTLRATGDASGAMTIERARLEDGEDSLNVSGAVRLPVEPAAWREALVDLEVTASIANLAPIQGPWTGRLRLTGSVVGPLVRAQSELTLVGEDVEVRGVRLEKGTFRGVIGERGVTFETLSLGGRQVSLRAAGALAYDAPSAQIDHFTLDVPRMGPVADALGLDAVTLRGTARATGHGRWSPDAMSLTTGIVVGDGAVDDVAFTRVALQVETDGDTFTVSDVEVERASDALQAAGTLRVGARELVVDRARLSRGEDTGALTRPLRLTWDNETIRLHDLAAVVANTTIEADLSARRSLDRFDVAALVVRLDGHTIRLTGPAAIHRRAHTWEIATLGVRSDDGWQVDTAARWNDAATEVDLFGVRVTLADSELQASGDVRLDRDGELLRATWTQGRLNDARVRLAAQTAWGTSHATIDQLDLMRGADTAHLREPLQLRWDDGGIDLRALDAEVLGARITGRAAWRTQPSADLSIHDVPLSRFIPELDGTGRAEVVLDGEAATLRFDAPALRVGAWSGSAQVTARQAMEGGIRVERILITGSKGHTLSGDVTLPYRITQDGLVEVDDATPSVLVTGTLAGIVAKGAVGNAPIQFRLEGDAAGLVLTGRLDDLVFQDHTETCDDCVFEVRVTKSEAFAKASLADEALLRVEADVRADRGFLWTEPESIRRFLDESHVTGRIAGTIRSWQPLVDRADGVREITGGAEAALRLDGPLRAPELTGSVTFDKFGARFDSDIAPITDLDARILWSRSQLRIERLTGQMGYAPFRLEGRAALHGSKPPVLDLRIHGRNVQLLRTNYVRMRIDVDATVKGPFDKMHLAGTGSIVEGLFREPISLKNAGSGATTPEILLFQLDEAPFRDMTFDLRVKADRSIRVRNNLFRADASVDATLRGSGKRPAPVGRAWFENADVILPLTTLRHGAGELVFREGSPGHPHVQATLQTRVSGYEMGVHATGEFPDVHLYVFTEPRLDDDDAILLLATGSTGAQLAAGGILAKGLSAVFRVFGGSLFTTRGEDTPGEISFFERFQFTTDDDDQTIDRLDAEIEMTERFYLHLENDRFDGSNFGFIWRLRFK